MCCIAYSFLPCCIGAYNRSKLAEKYNIPESYEPVMQGFFTSYMTQVYKAGKDMDTYEAVLTGVFKKVREKPAAPGKIIYWRGLSLSQHRGPGASL